MINYKAVFFGIVGGIAGATIGSFIVGMYAGAQGRSGSYEWFLLQNMWLLYAINISSGLACGWATYQVQKIDLPRNLFLASTSLFVLNIIANPNLINALGNALRYGRNTTGLMEQGLLPLSAAWAAPFVFILFASPKTAAVNAQQLGTSSEEPVLQSENPIADSGQNRPLSQTPVATPPAIVVPIAEAAQSAQPVVGAQPAVAAQAGPSDHDLMLHIKSGRRDAVGMLFDRYGSRLYEFVFLLIGDCDQAARILEEVFVPVPMQPLLGENESVRGWLYATACEATFGFLRQKGWRSPLPTEPPYAGLTAEIWRVAHAMRPFHLAVLILGELHGLSRAEAARALNVAESDLPSLAEQARQSFNAQYDEQARQEGRPLSSQWDPKHFSGLQRRLGTSGSLLGYLPESPFPELLAAAARIRILASMPGERVSVEPPEGPVSPIACPHCGAQNPADIQNCVICGKPFLDQGSGMHPLGEQGVKRTGSKLTWPVVFLIFSVLVFCACVVAAADILLLQDSGFLPWAVSSP